jgi:hypothetical protein
MAVKPNRLALNYAFPSHQPQIVFDAHGRPHLQLLPQQQARDCVFFTYRNEFQQNLRYRHAIKLAAD